MGIKQYFELREISSKIQCPYRSLHWEVGIVCFTCGKCMQPSERKSTVEQGLIQRLVNSRPRHKKRILPMEPDMNQLCWLYKYYKAHEMLKKAQKKQYKTILERWYNDDNYRKSLSDIGWNEEGIMQYDKIALEYHSYTATKEERSRNENFHGNSHWTQTVYKDHWISAMTLNEADMQKTQPWVFSNHWKWKQTYPSSATSPTKAQSAVWRPCIDLMLLQDGDTFLLPQRIRLHLRHHDGNQAATCGQRGTGSRGNLHLGVNFFFFSKKKKKPFQMSDFSLAGDLISWQSVGCVNSTPSAHTFFSCSFCQRACPTLLSQSLRLQPHCHALDPMRGSSSTLFVSCPKSSPHRGMSHVTHHLSITPTPDTCTSSLSLTQSSSHPLFSQLQSCADLRHHLSGAVAEPPSLTQWRSHEACFARCDPIFYCQ